MTSIHRTKADVPPPRRHVVIPWVAVFQLVGQPDYLVELHVPNWFSATELAVMFNEN